MRGIPPSLYPASPPAPPLRVPRPESASAHARGGALGGNADLARGTAVPSPSVRPPARPEAAEAARAGAAGARAQRAEETERRHSRVSAAPAPAAPRGGRRRTPSLKRATEPLSRVLKPSGCWTSAQCAACVQPEPGSLGARGRGRRVSIPRLLAEVGRDAGRSRCPGRTLEGPSRPVRMCVEPWPGAWPPCREPLCSAWPCGRGRFQLLQGGNPPALIHFSPRASSVLEWLCCL